MKYSLQLNLILALGIYFDQIDLNKISRVGAQVFKIHITYNNNR